jgi:ferritin-like metal-binding protein YciE
VNYTRAQGLNVVRDVRRPYRRGQQCAVSRRSKAQMEDHHVAHKETIVGWLNDAYVMEQSIERVLTNHAKDAKDHPEMAGRIKQHLEATKPHSEMVKSLLESLGEKPSTVKSVMSNIMGTVQGMSTEVAGDELVKNVLGDFSTEHMEIASYRSLIAAGEMYGDQNIVRTCETILQDEIAMATWLEQQIPVVTQMYLRQKASEHTSEQRSETGQSATS